MPTKAELEQELEQFRAALNQGGKPQDPEQAPDPWELLSRRFDPAVIRKNPRGYHYVQIDEVYNRLDEVLGPNWTLSVQTVQCAPVDPQWKTYGRKESTGFLASVTVRISALIAGNVHTVRDGVGADYADDPDKAIKTALANAVKKAANGFGVGRYLWKEEERAAIDEANTARNDTVELKKQVVLRWEAATGETLTGSPAEKLETLAKFFGVAKEDLASADTLNAILEGSEDG